MTLANDLEDAWITVAKLPPERRTDTLGSLPPRLWEKLRIALQAEYRQATGEPNATLTVTDSAASDARIAELEAEVERLRAGPKVRLLEWRNAPRAMADMQCEGIAAVGNNYVLTKLWHEQRGAEWCCLGYMYPTLEAAKAAAQADYEARILSALVQP